MRHHDYYVYITTNPNRSTLYIGMTNEMGRRLVEHYANRGFHETFAGKYYCYCLIYLECFQYVEEAIVREKELKDASREQKNRLIASFNPKWISLIRNGAMKNGRRGWFGGHITRHCAEHKRTGKKK